MYVNVYLTLKANVCAGKGFRLKAPGASPVNRRFSMKTEARTIKIGAEIFQKIGRKSYQTLCRNAGKIMSKMVQKTMPKLPKNDSKAVKKNIHKWYQHLPKKCAKMLEK